MTKEITNKVLQYLSNNIGYPHNVQDIATGVSADNETVSAVLKKLYGNHLAYYSGDYWYLTLEGKDYASGGTTIKRTREYYNQLKKFFAEHGLEIHDWREVSNPKYQEWLDEFEKRIDGSFRENHPEWGHIFNSIAPKRTDDADVKSGPRKFHAQEWRADSLAHFLKYDFSQKDMQYPKEKDNTYKAPKDIRTIEQSMAHSLDRFYNNVDQIKPYFIDKDRYRELHKSSNKVVIGIVKDKISEIEEFKTSAPGTVVDTKKLTNSTMRDVMDKLNIDDSVEKSVVEKFVEGYVSKSVSGISVDGLLFSSSQSPASIIATLKSASSREDALTVYSNFKDSSKSTRNDTSSILSNVFSGSDFSGKSFSKFGFDELKIENAAFNGCNLTESTWRGASVTSCSFQGATLNQARMSGIKSFTHNNIDGASFTDASLSIAMVSKDNIGKPVDMKITDMGTDTHFLKATKHVPTFTTTSIPIKPNEKAGVELLARAIKVLLSNNEVVSAYNSLELKHLRKFNIMKVADLPPNAEDMISKSPFDTETSTQMLEFAMGGVGPEFNFEGDLIDWVRSQAKGGNLKWMGKWTGKFMGNASQLNPKKEKELSPKEKDDIRKKELVNSFVGKHINEDKTHIGTIYQILEFEPSDGSDGIEDASSTYIGGLIYEMSSIDGEERYISLEELHNIYNSINATLSKTDELPQFPTNREYEHLPYSTEIFPIKPETMGRHNVSGKGIQFSILLKPNDMGASEDFMSVYEAALPHVGPHYDAIGFSRIQPIKRVDVDAASNVDTVSIVWIITEMQSDLFQKYGSEITNIRESLEDNGKDPNLANGFRSIIRHWAFNLLNVIITKAFAAGVDEIWMPPAAEVEEKTNSSSNWAPSYDVPAKAFGFKLERVSKAMKIDKGSSYSHETDQFYVLRVHGEDKMSSLKKLAVIDQGVLNKYVNDIVHHTRWIIENNKPKFEEVNAYVTDEMIAQFAWKTFFGEYGIPEEHANDPEVTNALKAAVKEELGFDIHNGPHIDWLHWYQKAIDDVNFFIKNQKEITPDLNASDEELARDWLKLWQEETLPNDIKSADWYNDLFIGGIVSMLQEKGYGDVVGSTYNPPPESRPESLLNFINNDTPGGELLDPEGEPIDPSTISPEERLELDDKKDNIFNDLSFDSFMNPSTDVVQEMTDDLLDELNNAMNNNDEEEANRIREQLREINSVAALKFTKA